MGKKELIHILKVTVYLSLIIQVFTLIFNVGIVSLDIFDDTFQEDVEILLQLVWLGIIVQIIEGTFYVWLAYYIDTISNITMYRYFDWFFTTPTMLITFVVYLLYLKDNEELAKERKKSESQSKKVDHMKEEAKKTNNNLFTYMYQNKGMLSIILLLNALMLLFGFFGEIGYISNTTTVLLGFIPFIAYFYLIYEHYAKYTTMGIYLFALFTGIWSFYGFAALTPYYEKNIGYNILDIVSKNFFEVFLGIKLLFAMNR